MLNVAYVLGRFPVLSETFIGEEIRALETLGHTIFPVALHKPQDAFQPADQTLADRTLYFSPLDAQAAKSLLRRNTLKRWRLASFARAQTTEPYIPLLVRAAWLADYIREKGCTHIHAHFGWGAATYAIAAAKLAKLPVTFTCHGSDVYARPLDLPLKCTSASAVFGVAPTITADLQKMAGNTDCHTVYCGVDTSRFAPPADWQQKHDRWLFVGRLVDCKGVDDILAAWRLLPPASRPKLDIVGEGSEKEKLQAYAVQHALEGHVSFLGAQPATWIAAQGPHYRGFVSAFRQGSDGSRDTSPVVLKEAMAMALPVVTTQFIDIPGLVGKECAMLCPPADADAIARAIAHIHTLPAEKLQKMGMAGRARVEQYYSLTQQAQQMTALWSSCRARR